MAINYYAREIKAAAANERVMGIVLLHSLCFLANSRKANEDYLHAV